jgi:hypothetical protein
MLTAALCRFCCKSPFALVVKNFPGFRRLTINSLTTSATGLRAPEETDDRGTKTRTTEARDNKRSAVVGQIFLQQEN